MKPDQVKEYLNSTIFDLEIIKDLHNKKYWQLKALYITFVTISLLSSSVVSVTTMFQSITPFTIINQIFSFLSLFSVGLLTQFDVSGQKQILKQQMDSIGELKEKLKYVVTCNGDLTPEEYKYIFLDIQKYNKTI